MMNLEDLQVGAEALRELLAVARGDMPADVVVRGGRVLNVFTGAVEEADVAIVGGRIAAVGPKLAGRDVVDVAGRLVLPGLIDTHVHVESSMLCPARYAEVVLARGTTTICADPHEIANVAGADGVRFMVAASEGLPLDVLICLPSCVPATHMGTAGGALDVATLAALATLPRVIGLAEFMNVPGAVLGLEGVIEKLLLFQDGHIDGHAPGLSGKWLQAYAAAGPGTDHECTTADEAREKLSAGLYVLIREGSAARDLDALLPAVTPANARRFAFATDDRHPDDLAGAGGIDNCVRRAVAQAMDPVTAVRMATLNAAEAMGLRDRGAVAPGRRADLLVVDRVEQLEPFLVMAGGRVVRHEAPEHPVRWRADNNGRGLPRIRGMRVDAARLDFGINAMAERLRVIGVSPGSLLTRHLVWKPTVLDGMAVADPDRDLAKLAVIERHRGTGNVGLGFVTGMGIQRGALATSVGHDCHNLTVVGITDDDMHTAVRSVVEMGGGLAVACGGKTRARLPLPVGGLMSPAPLESVLADQKELLRVVQAELGCSGGDPFMALSFLSLEVIPKLKLTDQGLVDVDAFELVPLWVS